MTGIDIDSLSWLAAAIDGEGSILLPRYGPNGRISPSVLVVNTNREFVDKAASLMGGRVEVRQPRGGAKKVAYVATLRRREEVEVLLRKLVPHLVIKKGNAEAFIEWSRRHAYHRKVESCEGMSAMDQNWLAAALDGEGCIHLYYRKYPSGTRIDPKISIFNTHRGFAEKAASLPGGSLGRREVNHVKRRPIFIARLSGRAKCIAILELLLPRLIVKRERAAFYLEWARANPPVDPKSSAKLRERWWTPERHRESGKRAAKTLRARDIDHYRKIGKRGMKAARSSHANFDHLAAVARMASPKWNAAVRRNSHAHQRRDV